MAEERCDECGGPVDSSGLCLGLDIVRGELTPEMMLQIADFFDRHEPEEVSRCTPFAARKAMADAIWRECISPGDNEWTTWTDSIALAECAANALMSNGWRVVRSAVGSATPTGDDDA